MQPTQPSSLVDMEPIEGRFEHVRNATIMGWAYDASLPMNRPTVQIFVDGELFVELRADRYRGDLERHGKGDGKYGFQYPLPIPLLDNQPHSVSIREKGTGSELAGSPREVTFSRNVPLLLQKANFETYSELIGSERSPFHHHHISGDPAFRHHFLPLGQETDFYETDPLHLYELQDVYVMFPDGVIFTEEKVLGKSLYLVNPLNYGHVTGVTPDTLEISFAPEEVEHISKPAFLAAGGSQYNYYHWHIDILPRLMALDYIEEKPHLWFAAANKFQKAMLHYITQQFEDYEFHYVRGEKICQFKRLYYTPGLGGKGERQSARIASFYDTLLQQLHPALEQYRTNKLPTRLYITRGNNPRRKLENENELIARLKKEFGFVAVNPGDYPYEHQVALFHHAEIIVGPHGAAFTNFLYCRDATKVLEIFPDKYINLGLQRLANLRGLKYRYALGTTQHKDNRSIHDLSFKAPVAAIISQVKELLTA